MSIQVTDNIYTNDVFFIPFMLDDRVQTRTVLFEKKDKLDFMFDLMVKTQISIMNE